MCTLTASQITFRTFKKIYEGLLHTDMNENLALMNILSWHSSTILTMFTVQLISSNISKFEPNQNGYQIYPTRTNALLVTIWIALTQNYMQRWEITLASLEMGQKVTLISKCIFSVFYKICLITKKAKDWPIASSKAYFGCFGSQFLYLWRRFKALCDGRHQG